MEIQRFMDDYAVKLVNKTETVGELYYDSGVVFSGFGRNTFLPFDTIKLMYQRRPKTMDYFKWEDMKIDPLNENLALVTSFFYEHYIGRPDTSRLSYTGLFIRTPTGWKIKHEHESRKCNSK